jgi:hypothetical protein
MELLSRRNVYGKCKTVEAILETCSLANKRRINRNQRDCGEAYYLVEDLQSLARLNPRRVSLRTSHPAYPVSSRRQPPRLGSLERQVTLRAVQPLARQLTYFPNLSMHSRLMRTYPFVFGSFMTRSRADFVLHLIYELDGKIYHFEAPFELALRECFTIGPDYMGLGVDEDAYLLRNPRLQCCCVGDVSS